MQIPHHHYNPPSVTRRFQQHHQPPFEQNGNRHRPTKASSSPVLVRKVPLYIAASLLVFFPLLAIVTFHTSSSSSSSTYVPQGHPDRALALERDNLVMARLGGAFGPPAVDGVGHNSSRSSSSRSTTGKTDGKLDLLQVLLVSTSVTGLSLTATWWFLNDHLEVPITSLHAEQVNSSRPGTTSKQSDIVTAAQWIVQHDLTLGWDKGESIPSSWIVLGKASLRGTWKAVSTTESGVDRANLHTVLHVLNPAELEQLKDVEHIVALTTQQVLEAILASETTTDNDSSSIGEPLHDTITLASLALGIAYIQSQTQQH